MNRITDAFKNKKALIACITGGDPDIETTGELICALEEAGADLIEIEIPFSDPVAGGPVAKAADKRALDMGCTTDKIFSMIKNIRKKTSVPFLFLTYLNPVYSYGRERFMENCKICGIDGIIVLDMPFEEKGELTPYCEKYGVDLISLIAPASGDRIEAIAKEARGFLYCVSLSDISKDGNMEKPDISEMMTQIKKISPIPCVTEFDASIPEQTQKTAGDADGIIVGNAIMEIIAEHGKNSAPFLKKYINEIKSGI